MPRFHFLLLTGRAQLQIPTRQSFNGQLKHLLEFAAFNLTSLIKLSENEHLKWGQIEQRKWMENSIHLQGHFKSNCITMKNDRKKGIFKSNINSTPQKPKFLNSVDADNSDSDDGTTPIVGNCQTDIAKLLNFHSV